MSEETKELPTNMHSLKRTSPKGGPFVGTCMLCGVENLGFDNMHDECPNPRGLTQGETLLEVLAASEPPAEFPKKRFKLPEEFFDETLADLRDEAIPTGAKLTYLVATARAHLKHLNDTLLLIARERNVTIEVNVGNTYDLVHEPTAPNIDITFSQTL